MNMQTFLLYLLITVLMAPLLAVYGLPFIAVARGFSRIARARIGDRLRRPTTRIARRCRSMRADCSTA
ncbi:hypothetical protein NCF_04838 [Burkholderia pseudomallei]